MNPDLVPESQISILTEYVIPSLTYQVKDGRIQGMIDQSEAMEQAVKKILTTDRMIYEIYSKEYGHDLGELIGKEFDYVHAVIELILQEALLADDRVDNVKVENMTIIGKSSLSLKVTVYTFWGVVKAKTEVEF